MSAIVADACFLLNLVATRRAQEIVRALAISLIVCPNVRGEALFLVGAPDPDDPEAKPQKEPVDLTPFEALGMLRVEPLLPDWADIRVRWAPHLRDNDAASVVLAEAMNLPLATDDGKVRRVVKRLRPEMSLLSTLQVLRKATTALELDVDATSALLHDLRVRGNFAPPRTDPDRSWYEAALQSRQPQTLNEQTVWDELLADRFSRH